MKSDAYIYNRTSILEHDVIRLQLKDSQTWFSIIPTYGAALNAFVVNGNAICLEAVSEKELKNQTIQAFAGTQLFPYPNRVNNARYNYNGQVFELPKNDAPFPHALHGLIYNQPFTIDEIDCKIGVIKTSYRYKKNHEGFPFEAHIKNTFQLEKNALTVSTRIENIGDTEFPFGHGWHPYFRTDDGVDDCALQVFGNTYFPVNENLIPNGSLEVIEDFLELNNIAAKNLNHCLVLNERQQPIKAILKTNKNTIVIELDGYNYLQIYTAPNRKSIAIEPQTCAPDALNNQIGGLHLKPKRAIELMFKIRV